MKLIVEVFLFTLFYIVNLPVKNGVTDDLVDEKGCHEDIYEFASKADIVVCCLSLNKETVRLCLSLNIFLVLLLCFIDLDLVLLVNLT